MLSKILIRVGVYFVIMGLWLGLDGVSWKELNLAIRQAADAARGKGGKG